MNALGIIPTYLSEPEDVDMLWTTVKSIRETVGPKIDVLLVDDASPASSSLDFIQSQADEAKWQLEIIHKPENEGFATTVNHGLRRCRENGQDAVLINSDIEFIDGAWLSLMQKSKDTKGRPSAIVGARLMYPNGLLQHAGVYFSLLHRCFEHNFKYGPHDLPEALVSRECPVTAALQFIRNSTLKEVGLYDEDFKLGWEDVDYCIRTFEHGLACVYEPKVRAWHHESFFRGPDRQNEKMRQWINGSWATFCHKHADSSFARFVPPVAA